MSVGPSPRRARSGLADDEMAGDDVVAVDPNARHPVADRLVGQRRRPVLVALRGGDCPSVVLHVDDAGRLLHRGEVQRLVDVALARRSVADERHGDAVVAEPARCHGGADGVERVGSDGDGDRCDAPLDEAEPAVPRAAPREPYPAGVDPPNEEDAELAVLREEPVRVAEGGSASDLRCFLAFAGREECELALSLEVDELLVELAGGDHRLVEAGQLREHDGGVESASGVRRPVGGDELHGVHVGCREEQVSHESPPARLTPWIDRTTLHHIRRDRQQTEGYSWMRVNLEDHID
jgi:hypothetical protein